MSTLIAATWVFALLLVVAGSGKIARPAGSGDALRAVGLPADERLARALGVAEVGLGGAVLLAGGRPLTSLLAVAYALFAVVAQRQRRRGGSCGCFGTTTTPATALHVWFDIVAAAVTASAMAVPDVSLPATVLDEPLHGMLTVLLVTVVTGVLRLVLTAVPDLHMALALAPPRTDA